MTSVFKDFSPRRIPSRISITLLCTLCVTELYISRTNLSIAIVSMVRTVTEEMIHSDAKKDPFCLRSMNNNSDQEEKYFTTNFTAEKSQNEVLPPIQMTSTERGNLLSSVFYAIIISSIPGGRLAEIYGSKKVCGVILMMDVLANFLTPLVSQSSYWLFFSLRITTGFFHGMCYPAVGYLLGQWIPPSELSRTISFVFHGNNLGTLTTMVLGGYIISLFGWEYVFYFSGSFSLLCLTLWIFFIFDKPETHPRISPQEKLYIIDTMKERKPKKKPDNIPWRKLLQSFPIWAINVAHAGSMCGLNFLVTQIPIFMSSIIGVNIRTNGLLSALPFIGRYAGSNASSWLLYYIRNKFNWKLKTLRRVGTITALVGPGVSFVLVGYIGCDHWSAILLFTLGAALNGFATSGYLCSCVDFSPNFAGTVFGICTTFGMLVSMTVPVAIGALTPEETISEWRTVFWLLFGNYVATSLFYTIFVSTDLPPWDSKNEETDDENTEGAEMKLTSSCLNEPVELSVTQSV